MMRKTFRLRTFLVALVLLAIPLAYFGDRWRRCDFEYFRRHARLAQQYYCEAKEARSQVVHISRRLALPPFAAGSSGAGSTALIPSSARLQRKVVRLRKVAKAADQQFRYHRRIAGRAYQDTGCISL
jgi:hypothetical protein